MSAVLSPARQKTKFVLKSAFIAAACTLPALGVVEALSPEFSDKGLKGDTVELSELARVSDQLSAIAAQYEPVSVLDVLSSGDRTQRNMSGALDDIRQEIYLNQNIGEQDAANHLVPQYNAVAEVLGENEIDASNLAYRDECIVDEQVATQYYYSYQDPKEEAAREVASCAWGEDHKDGFPIFILMMLNVWGGAMLFGAAGWHRKLDGPLEDFLKERPKKEKPKAKLRQDLSLRHLKP